LGLIVPDEVYFKERVVYTEFNIYVFIGIIALNLHETNDIF